MPEEQFLVSARKYRPDTFASVVGQSVVTSTLKRQLLQKRTAQAYLFCGPRGVGKTTCARIFAKALNCRNLTPEGEPCNECPSCKAFEAGSNIDILEIDAASNNSTDSMKELIAGLEMSLPRYGSHSVYIIDEVHMLSAAAFNTFLKTLEEPPAHVVFILATTEKHKVLATVLSRCQIFDFNRIQVDDTITFLANIAEKEDVKCDREALNLIALKADGAMRDALSSFDQVVSFSDGYITRERVIESLNLLDVDLYFQITDDVLKHDYMHALSLLNKIVLQGFNLAQFLSGFTMHLRNMLLAANASGLQLLDVGTELAEKYNSRSKEFPIPLLIQSLQISSDAEATLQGSSNQRLHVEILLLTLCEPSDQKKNA